MKKTKTIRGMMMTMMMAGRRSASDSFATCQKVLNTPELLDEIIAITVYMSFDWDDIDPNLYNHIDESLEFGNYLA